MTGIGTNINCISGDLLLSLLLQVVIPKIETDAHKGRINFVNGRRSNNTIMARLIFYN